MSDEPVALLDETLQTLLELNGEEYNLNGGYWTKIEAFRVPVSEHQPYGIRYCLTLHDRLNNRILGFDNKHQVKTKKNGIFRARITRWDHMHKFTQMLPYEYRSASQLITDFWREVNAITKYQGG